MAAVATPRRAPESPATRATLRRIEVAVRRSASGARREFCVEARDPVTVLDLLREIQRRHDGTLAFRWSCRVAMCGTCALRVDGRSALACRTVVPPETGAVELAPLAGLPVVRDLIVDTGPFWSRWRRVEPWFVPREEAAQAPAPASVDTAATDAALGCIACGACYSSCGVAGARSDYLGPAALNRAFALIADPRDGAADRRLALVGGRGGVDRCHYMGSCTEACPIGLDPARSIVELRRLRLRRR